MLLVGSNIVGADSRNGQELSQGRKNAKLNHVSVIIVE